MAKRNEWEEFFDGHAPIYMKNAFTSNTRKEVDFILEMMELHPGSSILDVGCGTGRHSVELAKRGYKVTGVDLSSGMLTEAKKAARAASVKVEWVHSNAAEYRSRKLFDGAICLCEGAFGLLGSTDDPIIRDLTILRNIQASVKPKAHFILTCLNGLEKIRKFSKDDVEKGKFDPNTLVETFSVEYDSLEGKKSVQVRERGYVPTELMMLFHRAGLEVEHIWGGTAANWGRRKVELDEIEIMVVARKPCRPSRGSS